MTKTATYQLTLVLFSTLTLGGCGKDPFAGDSPGTDGALLGTGGTTSDAPSGTPTIDYKICASPSSTAISARAVLISQAPAVPRLCQTEPNPCTAIWASSR